MCSNCAGDYERPDEPTQVERLAHPKLALVTPEDRVEQLCKSVAAAYFGVHIAQQVENLIGTGDPFQLLLQDEFNRRKFNLSPRGL